MKHTNEFFENDENSQPTTSNISKANEKKKNAFHRWVIFCFVYAAKSYEGTSWQISTILLLFRIIEKYVRVTNEYNTHTLKPYIYLEVFLRATLRIPCEQRLRMYYREQHTRWINFCEINKTTSFLSLLDAIYKSAGWRNNEDFERQCY
jgi:hypothetical protein